MFETVTPATGGGQPRPGDVLCKARGRGQALQVYVIRRKRSMPSVVGSGLGGDIAFDAIHAHPLGTKGTPLAIVRRQMREPRRLRTSRQK